MEGAALINDLKKTPQFLKAMMEIKKAHRPIVKPFDPRNPIAIDEWKYQSGLQAGFDLLYSVLTGEIQ